MTDFIQLITLLVIILFAAKLAGRLSVKFGQPSVFGELLVGIFLGPSMINLANLPFITNSNLMEFIDNIGEIGVLLLMFLAGIELHIRDLARSSRLAMYSGSLGVLFPIIMGGLCGYFFRMNLSSSLFLGLALAATSVSISAQTLMEMGKLKTRIGTGLLGAAVYDDILVILLFSIFLASIDGSLNFLGILWLFLRMMLFFSLAGFFGYYILPVLSRLIQRTSTSYGSVTFSLIVLFIFGIAAEILGNMAAITGTFLAGLFFSRTREKEIITEGISNLAYGFFVPIFFISIGLKTNLTLFSAESFLFLLVVTIVAILSKILGAGLGARIGGFSWLEAYQLGTGMISRGEVGLIIASIGVRAGIIEITVLTNIVILILITTLVTPVLLNLAFSNPPGFLIPRSITPPVSDIFNSGDSK
ncbi:MAG: cation:proton antiporter [Chloroflexi bacterium]|nr:cation:proton antiporter [Chloroflexota bacterium]